MLKSGVSTDALSSGQLGRGQATGETHAWRRCAIARRRHDVKTVKNLEEISDESVFEALSDIAGVTDSTAIPALLQRLTERYGVKTVAYLGTGIAGVTEHKPYLAVTYSSEWVEHYRARNYVKIDPVIQVGMRRLLPIDWDEFGSPEGELEAFFGEAAEFGLGRRGISVPIHGRNGDRALVTITSDYDQREWSGARKMYMRDFQVLAVHLHEMVLRIEGNPGPRARLSPREQECLQWVAEGKTVWECATILGLSLHTVRCYLESARHKLSASSNTHAVSIALTSGLLVQLP